MNFTKDSQIMSDVTNTINNYVKENHLHPIETLLEKELPVSLMGLYVEEFDGLDMSGITTVEFLKGYKQFLEELRDLYQVKVKKQTIKRK